jgi:nucleotidyltransferase/DNA polymerase involved in DNA repair
MVDVCSWQEASRRNRAVVRAVQVTSVIERQPIDPALCEIAHAAARDSLLAARRALRFSDRQWTHVDPIVRIAIPFMLQ